jgi:NADPH:quinone reductase-like Zn-dependent oxidoreductase
VKARRLSRCGEPEDVLELTEVPRPVPGRSQLLVRVLAAAANFPDALLCRGTYQVRPLITERLPLPDVPDALRRLAAGDTTGRIVFQP